MADDRRLLGARPRRRVRHAAVRVRRGSTCAPLPRGRGGVRTAAGRSTRRRRSCAGRWPASPTKRACCSTWRSGGELHVALAAGVPGVGVHPARQQQDVGRAAHGDRSRRPPRRRRLVRRARSARGARRRGRRPDPRRAAPDHPGRARPHPRVHRHRSGRLEVRLQPRQRRRHRAVDRARRSRAVEPRRPALPHRLQRVRGVDASARRPR